jgi:hypothetical protein
MMTAVIEVKCFETTDAQVFIMKIYLLCTSYRNLMYASMFEIKGLNLTEMLNESSIWAWGLIMRFFNSAWFLS